MPSYRNIIIKEYEALRIGSRWSPDARTITKNEAAAILQLQKSTGKRIFRTEWKSLVATNWVGTIGIGDRCIEVIPKLDTEKETKIRENLLYMISIAGLVQLSLADIAQLANTGQPLLIAYMDLYVHHLTNEWRRGPIRQYVVQEENRHVLKGKLFFQDQIRMNFIHQERFFTASDELIEDHPLSRLLKAALVVCQRQHLSSSLSQKARSLMPDFDTVTNYATSDQWDRITVDRQHRRFEPLVNMAKLILQAVSPASGKDSQQIYSLMFDMNEVFEKYVAAVIKSVLCHKPFSVKSQASSLPLLLKDEKPQFRLRPDVTIKQGDKMFCILDTKWKILNRAKNYDGVEQSDVYQMYAYGKEYQSPRTILLYPRHGNLEPLIARYHFPTNSRQYIEVRTLDVSSPWKEKNVPMEIEEMLRIEI